MVKEIQKNDKQKKQEAQLRSMVTALSLMIGEGTKHWYQSKTLWAGIGVVVWAGVETYLSGGDHRAVIAAVAGAVFVSLRFVTNKSIK